MVGEFQHSHVVGSGGAIERRDFGTAERWYLKALASDERREDALGAAYTRRLLGRVAREQNDFDAAAEWFLQALPPLVAHSKHELGTEMDLTRFARCLLGATAQVQVRLRERWRVLGLDRMFDLAALERSLAAEEDGAT